MSIISYIKDTKGELNHVSWPSRKDSIIFTAVVIIVSILTSLFLGFFDLVFSKILNLVI